MGYWKNWISSVAEDYKAGLTIDQLKKEYNATEDQILMAISIYFDKEVKVEES